MQHKKRDQHGKRNREKNRCCGAKASQENPNHDGGKQHADSAFAQHRRNGALDENRLIKHDIHFQLRGNISKRLDRLSDAVHDRDCVGIPSLLQDGDVHGLLPVHAHDVVLQKRAVNRFSDIGDEHGLLAFRFQRDAVDNVGIRHLRVGINVVVHRADAHVTRGKNQVRFIDGSHHIHGTQFVRLQLQRVHIHHDLPVASAVRRRHGSARNSRNLVANAELQIIMKLGFA